MQERLGGREDPRLVPLLACLIELLPWLKQWHNDVDPEYGEPMGDYFEGFIQEEAKQMGELLVRFRRGSPRVVPENHLTPRREVAKKPATLLSASSFLTLATFDFRS